MSDRAWRYLLALPEDAGADGWLVVAAALCARGANPVLAVPLCGFLAPTL